jgi:hypothetical protein
LRTWQGEPSPGADVAVVDAVVPSGCKVVRRTYLPTPRNASESFVSWDTTRRGIS